MTEKIVNIYLIIEGNYITEIKAIAYEKDGSDSEKIEFLKSQAENDLNRAINFDTPQNNKGELMTFKEFNKLSKYGNEYKLFEMIFEYFELPENPLICVNPIVDGKIMK